MECSKEVGRKVKVTSMKDAAYFQNLLGGAIAESPAPIEKVVEPEIVRADDVIKPVFIPDISTPSVNSPSLSPPQTNSDMSGLTTTLTTTIGTAIGGPVGGAIGAIVGGLFEGPGEDKSTTGFNTYMASGDRSGVTFPTKAQIVAAGQNAGWPSDNIAAIQATYDQTTGTGNEGDWKFAVSSLNPLAITFFKGSGEKFVRASTAAFTTPTQSPSNAGSQSAQTAAFSGGTKPATPTQQIFGVAWYIVAGIGVALLGIGYLIFKRKRR